MTNKSIVLWLKGAAGVVGSLVVLGSATWVLAGPAIDKHIEQRIYTEIGGVIEKLDEQQVELQSEINQNQRTLGKVETEAEKINENVQLILRLLLEQQSREQ